MPGFNAEMNLPLHNCWTGPESTLSHWKSRFNTIVAHIVLNVDSYSWLNRELQQSSYTDTLCWSRQCLHWFLSALFNTSAALNNWRTSSFPTVRWFWFQFCSSTAERKDATSKTSLYLKLTYTQVMSRKETQTKHGWWQIQEDGVLRDQAKCQTFLHWNFCLLLDCTRVLLCFLFILGH